MDRKTKGTGVTRREFVKTVGLAGLVAAGAGVPGAIADTKEPAGALLKALISFLWSIKIGLLSRSS